ncbi:hypothetical protein ACFVFD_15625 [Streptomyces fimicarius]|uniref:hypothetical protein n=1 Tax=Streptomyces griseus TaxID=1911 RepID=UPI0036B73E3C
MAGNKHSRDLLEGLQRQISSSNYEIDPASLGGRSSYKDPKTNFFKDLSGIYTNGEKGPGIPEVFMGSYDQVHQVISVNKKEKTFTVAFGAYNETGVESLAHVFPDIGQGKGMGTLHQSYYWTVTVGS